MIRQGSLLAFNGTTSSKDVKKEAFEKRMLFLFSDMIILAKPDISSNKNQNDKFTYCSSLLLDGIEVIDEAELVNSFSLKEINSDNIICTFIAENDKEKKSEFIQDIDDALWKRFLAWRSVSLFNKENYVPDLESKILKTGSLNIQRNNTWKLYQSELNVTELRLFGISKKPLKLNTLKANVILLPIMDRPFCLEISLSSRTYYLAAESESERLLWVNTIRNSIRKQLQNLKEPEKSPEGDKKTPKRDSKVLLSSLKKTRPIRTKNTGSRKDKKKSIIYKDSLSENKFKKCIAQLKDGSLIIEKAKKELETYDSSSLTFEHQITEIKDSERTLFVLEITSENQSFNFATETKEDLEDWIEKLSASKKNKT